MEYLVSRKVLHGDLAARNILLADDNIVKICDFGLAKSMYKSDNYRKKGDGPLPIKWMAIESIRDRVFSTQSDVWSFGVVLWEFFSLARTPYPGMEVDEKLYNKLVVGYRMERPDFATADIYEVMLSCWETNPDERPSFMDLAEILGNKLEESVRMRYIGLNDPYMNMNAEWLQGLQNDYLSMMNSPTYRNMVSPTIESIHFHWHLPLNIEPTSEEAEGSGYLCMKTSQPEEVIFSPRLKESNIFRFSPHLQNQRRLRNEEVDGAGMPEQKPMLNEGRNNMSSDSDTEMDDMEKGSSNKERKQTPEEKTRSFSNPNYQPVTPLVSSNISHVNIPQQNNTQFGKLRMPSESLSTNSEFSELFPSPSNLPGDEPMKFGNEVHSNKSPLQDRFQHSFFNPNYQSLMKTQNDAYVNIPQHNRRVSDASSGFQSDAGENLLVN
ncbi:hypothetical protein C0J52_18673 [Blattella germanica]|nr:hypothetical protein C0J52_18673 [Blattella germanica]